METDVYSEKAGILDVLVQTEDGKQIDLEMQVGNYQYAELRLTKYACMLFSNGIKKGEGYESTRKTIVLMFVKGEMPRLKKYEEYSFKWNYNDVVDDVFEANAAIRREQFL